MASDKFSLKWNDYQSNWSQSLSGLRNDTEMSDVTLITDDKVKVLAHKILLSSCSNVFNFILKESKQTSPLLYLGGIGSANRGFILDYIYYGEVNLYQEQLDGFLESAQKLEISGLMGVNQRNLDDQECEFKDINNSLVTIKEEEHKEPQENRLVSIYDKSPRQKVQYNTRTNTTEGKHFDVTGMTPEEIGAKIRHSLLHYPGIC